MAWYTNVAEVLLSFNITMAVVRSSESALYLLQYRTERARVFYRQLYQYVKKEYFQYTITFTECQKKKNGCQKFTNWYSLTDCKKKTLISTCRSVLVDVFLNIIPNCYKCADNLKSLKRCGFWKWNPEINIFS